MRVIRIATVALIASLALAVSPGTAMVQQRRAAAIPRRPFGPSVSPVRLQRRRFGATQCTENASVSFVGIPGQQNVAGGAESAVLGGINNEACDTSSSIFGGLDGDIGNSGGAMYSFIGGGTTDAMSGRESAIGTGALEVVTGDYAFVGAGNSNAAGNDAFVASGNGGKAMGTASFIGAGGTLSNLSCPNCSYHNEAAGVDSFVGAGDLNLASGNGSFVGAGGYEIADVSNPTPPANQASGEDAFVGAGDLNTAAGAMAFIGGGQSNSISAAGTAATILGGSYNAANGANSTIGGGYGNTAAGSYATVPGGYDDNAIGELSFAAGYHAHAGHNGSFVWSDYVSGSNALDDTAADQFLVRASGGTFVYSNEAATSGVELAPGSGTWANLSDRAAKTNIAPLDERSVLASVEALPIGEWRYRSEASVQHAGPMAQDFYAAFGIGEGDRHIATIDEGGIALAAAAALHRDDASLADDNARLTRESARTLAESSGLEAALAQSTREQVAIRKTFDRIARENAGIAADDERLLAKAVAFERSTRRMGATTCTTNASPSFVGVMSENNVAGGAESAVLGGQHNTACDQYAAIGGGAQNAVGDNGSAFDSFIGGGNENQISDAQAFIGAGALNTIPGTGGQELIGAGQSNTATGADGAVVAGFYNTASGEGAFVGAGGLEVSSLGKTSPLVNNVASGTDSFVGAGDLNRASGNGSFIGAGGYVTAATGSEAAGNQVSGTDAFIGAGDGNVSAGDQTFVGAGQSNSIAKGVIGSTIAGGTKNADSGAQSTLAGGYGNTVSGAYATLPGGYGNVAAGELSLAAGYHAMAAHNGSFVWSDYHSGSAVVEDAAANQFVVRASGGTHVYSHEAATAGVVLAAGSGAWSSLSDRGAKMGERSLDEHATLAALSKLTIDRWSYRTETGATHIGPMAQDFYAAFGIGEDARHITSIDEEGIALAAIGALDRADATLKSEHERLHARNAQLQASFARLLAASTRTLAETQRMREREDAMLADNARLVRDRARLSAVYAGLSK